MGTQKNHLNEMVLLSTHNAEGKGIYTKFILGFAYKYLGGMTEDSAFTIFLWKNLVIVLSKTRCCKNVTSHQALHCASIKILNW